MFEYFLLHFRAWDAEVYSDLSGVRDIGAILDALFEALDPLQEGVAGCVSEDMDEEEDEYGGNLELGGGG